MEARIQSWGFGGLIALVVFIVALVMALTNNLPWAIAGLIMALAIARLT